MLKRILCFILMALPFLGISQVTTSSVYGIVKDAKNVPLEGASVKAVHTPSGTTYMTTTNKSGNFSLPGLRVGGPYEITIEYVGLKKEVIKDVYLALGEPFSVNTSMQDANATSEVTVNTTAKKKGVNDKTGTTTVIGQKQLTTLPNISRSIADFTKLTPQASGNNFAGRSGKYNTVMVDGANLNNNFGLNDDPLPGGGNQPISLDAYDEVSVSLAPYDVRLGNFTGAGVFAVTKSGTNTYKGSAYAYYRNQSFNGSKVNGVDLGQFADQSNKIFGATLGGPIIKNKLFFFVSGEMEERSFPGVTFRPKGGTGAGNESSTSVDSLKKLSDFLRSKYGYETGAYDNFDNFKSKNHKILAKIDWNVSNKHRVTAKYTEMVSENDAQLNNTSVPNGGGFSVVGATGSLTRLPNNRFGLRSMSFANSNLGFKDVVRSGALELNSSFSKKVSNQLVATFTKIKATRTSPSKLFPSIDFFNNDGQNYMSAGYDPFTYNNDVYNDVFNITDNVSYYLGKHTITGGVSYEKQTVGNMFMSASNSYYIFNSLNDFITDKAPAYYAYTYSLVPGKSAVYSAELKIAQLSAYIQDDINISDKFKLTVGLRADRPDFTENPLENPAITKLSLYAEDGSVRNYSTGVWPKEKIYWSPRIGFRWDVEGNKSLIVRGGTGIFTGRLPYVWLTNIPTNSGMYQFGASVTTASALAAYKFNPNPDAYKSTFPSVAGTAVTPNFVVSDPNFKFPQIFRSNLGFDKNLGDGWNLTMDLMLTQDINSIRMRNANQKAPNARFNGPDNRQRYLASGDRRLNSAVTTAIVLENTGKGHSGTFTTQINKTFNKNLSAFVAYNFTYSQEVTANPGNQASSVWNSNAAIGTQNDLELYNSNYAVPHRIIGSLTYRVEYLKHLATTFSLFYEGAKQGYYSYVVNGDLNNDGNNSTDLLYVPNSASELNFETFTSNGVTFTAAQQAAAFDAYIDQDKYLKNRRGKYAERNSAGLPWLNRVDAKIIQDVFTNIGKRKHTLQITADILNVANLLNSEWGIRQQTIINNPLTYRSVNAAGQPVYRMTLVNNQLPTKTFQSVQSTSSTWGLQLGVRYIF
jgi:outer membrane receptor protein involved in Fe transport